MNRETIYSTLFNKLVTATGVITSSRILKMYTEVDPKDQPALFQIQVSETPTQQKTMPVKWTLNVDVYLYIHRGGDPKVIPSQKINEMLDAIEYALRPDAQGFQTLGGLVSHCWISGKIQTSEGILGEQEVAIIPIEMYLYNAQRG